MSPYEQDGIVYVPVRATHDSGRVVGDGYVPLSSLTQAERERWERDIEVHGLIRVHDTLSAAARRLRDEALAEP